MSLTSDATKDNSTYINLILDPTIGDTIVPVDASNAVKVDITEQVLDAINGFSSDSIVGFEYQIDNYAGNEMFYSADDIYALVNNIDVILNAAMVNEKQKAAVSQMIHSSASRIVNDKRDLYLSRVHPLVDEMKRHEL
jgi:hypothetical protein